MLLVILLRWRRFLSGILALSVLLMVQATFADVIATEIVRDENLNFRGQGKASLCYAFAEEQLLKDLDCSGNCSGNADEWKLSIFDIAKVHQEKAVKDHPGLITGDVMVDLTSNGSSHFFPYSEMGVRSVRASKCTLEKELFYLNRAMVTNPERLQFHDYVMDLYDRFSANTLLVTDIEQFVPSAAGILKQLATSSSDRYDFLAKAINYTSCSDKVQVPEVSVNKEDISDESKIKELVLPLLKEGRSLYVGVCAEVIKSEKKDKTPCGRHAVVLKGMKDPSCKGDKCMVGVIDSAFFSLQPMDEDGSTWLPLKIVVQAISKSSLDFQRIIAKAKADNKAVIDGFAETAKQSAKEFIQSMKDALKEVPEDKLKDTLIAQIEKMGSSGDESNDITKALMSTVIQEAKKLSINNLSDLDLLEVPVQNLFLTFYQDYFTEKLSKMDNIQGNGIVWVEKK